MSSKFRNPTLVLIFGLLLGSIAFGQKVKVQKYKNGRAVIETNAILEEGRTYYISDGPISKDVNFSVDGLRSRKNSISFDFSYNNISASGSDSSDLSAKLRYGWNFSIMEFGPLVKYQYSKNGSTSSSAYLIGGFFDYNLVPNKDGAQLVYGINALAGYGNSTPTSGLSSSLLALAGGGFLKWFIFHTHLALRADLGYEVDQLSRSSGNVTASGIYTSVGLAAYY